MFISFFPVPLFPGGRENCSDDDVRLFGGQDEREGVLQFCYKGVWGVECDKSTYYLYYDDSPFLQNDENANVVCKQLGFLEPNRSKQKLSKGMCITLYLSDMPNYCIIVYALHVYTRYFLYCN